MIFIKEAHHKRKVSTLKHKSVHVLRGDLFQIKESVKNLCVCSTQFVGSIDKECDIKNCDLDRYLTHVAVGVLS